MGEHPALLTPSPSLGPLRRRSIAGVGWPASTARSPTRSHGDRPAGFPTSAVSPMWAGVAALSTALRCACSAPTMAFASPNAGAWRRLGAERPQPRRGAADHPTQDLRAHRPGDRPRQRAQVPALALAHVPLVLRCVVLHRLSHRYIASLAVGHSCRISGPTGLGGFSAEIPVRRSGWLSARCPRPGLRSPAGRSPALPTAWARCPDPTLAASTRWRVLAARGLRWRGFPQDFPRNSTCDGKIEGGGRVTQGR